MRVFFWVAAGAMFLAQPVVAAPAAPTINGVDRDALCYFVFRDLATLYTQFKDKLSPKDAEAASHFEGHSDYFAGRLVARFTGDALAAATKAAQAEFTKRNKGDGLDAITEDCINAYFDGQRLIDDTVPVL
jgi:hypothetical protein